MNHYMMTHFMTKLQHNELNTYNYQFVRKCDFFLEKADIYPNNYSWAALYPKQHWAMNGEKQKTIDNQFPFQKKLPQHVWKEWRMALRQSFLKRSDKNAHSHQLLSPLQKELLPVINFAWTPQMHMCVQSPLEVHLFQITHTMATDVSTNTLA